VERIVEDEPAVLDALGEVIRGVIAAQGLGYLEVVGSRDDDRALAGGALQYGDRPCGGEYGAERIAAKAVDFPLRGPMAFLGDFGREDGDIVGLGSLADKALDLGVELFHDNLDLLHAARIEEFLKPLVPVALAALV